MIEVLKTCHVRMFGLIWILLLNCVNYSPCVATFWHWLQYLFFKDRLTCLLLAEFMLYFESFVWICTYLVNKLAMVDMLSNWIYAWHPWVWFAQKGVENYPLGKKAWSLSNQVHSWHPCLQLASKDVQVDFILVGWGVDRPGPFMTPMFALRVRKAPRQEKEKKKRKENKRKKEKKCCILFSLLCPASNDISVENWWYGGQCLWA